MFVCELFGPWLLLVPCTPIRRVGVVLQVPLQLGIAATGNYNWFNLQTLILLLPAWAADVTLVDSAPPKKRTAEAADRAGLPRHEPLPWAQRLLAPAIAWERLFKSAVGTTLASAAAIAFVIVASALFFPVRVDWKVLGADANPDHHWMAAPLTALDRVRRLFTTNGGLSIENRADEQFVQWMLGAVLQPHVLGACLYTVTAVSAVGYAMGGDKVGAAPAAHRPEADGSCRRALRRVGGLVAFAAFAWRVAVGFASLLLLGVTLLPLESIAQRNLHDLIPATGGLRASTLALHWQLTPLHASNSYGLFRRMTGVGPRSLSGVPKTRGWGGLPPMVVQVPVVVLEGHPHPQDPEGCEEAGDGCGWVEIPFRYTPGATARAPRRTAPHQPRLDWQMWFAALGDYQHNPWKFPR